LLSLQQHVIYKDLEMLRSQKDLDDQLKILLDGFKDYLGKLRTGRPNPGIFEGLEVEAYGTQTPLKSIANVIIESATSVVIQPYDKGIVQDIVKAVFEADLGYSPVDDGDKVRIGVPTLTEEKRKENVKQMYRVLEEDYKKQVRQVRQDFMQKVDRQEGISEDEQEASKKGIQKSVDEVVSKLDELAEAKENDMMRMD
jgi:ribosome recycling factor